VSSPSKYYCGPFYFPKFLKKWLSKRFNYACYIHDIAYINKDRTRKSIDKEFLQLMLRVSSSTKDRVFAHIFYVKVRMFGWISWLIVKNKEDK
jgi:hypothetical protein